MMCVSLANPRDIGVEDFSIYELILDTRTEEEFALDHIPNAQNVPPIREADYDGLRTVFAADEKAGAELANELAAQNADRQLADYAQIITPGARVLVYCAAGEGRSLFWKQELERLGARVDVLPGGYMDYRAWVVASLQELPALFDFRVISGASWSGQTDLLRAIAAEGGQTIDVAYLWEHHGGRTRGKGAQDLIESYVLDRMRKLDQRKPVWIEDSTDRRVMQVLPEAIRAAARKSAHCMISAPMAERIKRASSETRFMREHVGALVQSVVKGARCLATGEKDTLRRPAKRGSVDEAMVALIAAQDRDNEQRLRGFRGEDLTVLRVPALDAATLREAAKSLVLEHC